MTSSKSGGKHEPLLSRRIVLFLGVLVSIALAVRLYQIDQYLLIVDEGNSLFRIQRESVTLERLGLNQDSSLLLWLGQEFMWEMHRNTHSFLPYFFIKILVQFGVSPVVAARIPTAILGGLSVPAMYLFWANVSRREALIASTLISVLPFYLLYSRYGKFEVPIAFFALLYSSVLFAGLKASGNYSLSVDGETIDGRIDVDSQLVLIVSSGLLFLIGYLMNEQMAVLLPGVSLYLVLKYGPRELSKFIQTDSIRSILTRIDSRLYYYTASLVPFLIFYAVYPFHVVSAQGSGGEELLGINVDGPVEIFWLHIKFMLTNTSSLFGLTQPEYGNYFELFTIPVVLLAVVGFASFVSSRRDKELYVLIQIAGIYGITTFVWASGLYPRFTILIVPFVLYLAVRGLVKSTNYVVALVETNDPVRTETLATSVVTSILVLFLLVYSVQSLFVPAPVGPHSQFIHSYNEDRDDAQTCLNSYISDADADEIFVHGNWLMTEYSDLWTADSTVIRNHYYQTINESNPPELLVVSHTNLDLNERLQLLTNNRYNKAVDSGRWLIYHRSDVSNSAVPTVCGERTVSPLP